MAAALLHELLDEAAERRPDHPAVRCNGEQLTYRELRDAANGIAATLIEHGVERGDRVGILLPKRVETIAAVYGALKAGAAYVPLDPRAPISRVAGVAADCAVNALITTPSRASALLETGGEALSPGVVILVDAAQTDTNALGPSAVPYEHASQGSGLDSAVAMTSDDLAYILYTSGSTGVPKGVMLTHGNALAFVNWCAVRIGVAADDRVSNHAPLHFDLSVLDLYLPTIAGATLVLVPEDATGMGAELVRFIREESITLWYSVPSALMMITRSAGGDAAALASLRTVVFAGEVYPMKHLRELRTLLSEDVPLWNLYGPTETNVCTYFPVENLPARDNDTLPIGRACENGTQAFAVDKDDGIVDSVGGQGELLVAGPTVMRGYWGMPERTAEALIPDPRGGEAPVYRTGDVVRLRDDGGFDFLGRRDHQIKSRGYRIELGEIEAALNANPDLAEAVAVAVPHEEWGTAIIACAVARPEAKVRPVDVRRKVAERLPRYMVPVRVDLLDEMPRTPNGKMDRAAVQAAAASKPL